MISTYDLVRKEGSQRKFSERVPWVSTMSKFLTGVFSKVNAASNVSHDSGTVALVKVKSKVGGNSNEPMGLSEIFQYAREGMILRIEGNGGVNGKQEGKGEVWEGRITTRETVRGRYGDTLLTCQGIKTVTPKGSEYVNTDQEPIVFSRRDTMANEKNLNATITLWLDMNYERAQQTQRSDKNKS